MTKRTALVAILLAAGCAPAALAQSKPAGEPPALRGPEVRDRDVPGAPGSFGPRREGPQGGMRVRAQVYLQALEALRAEGVPAELRLTPEQDEKIRAIHEDFRAEQRAHMDKHRDEVRRLRQEAGGPGSGERPGPGGPPEARRPGGRPGPGEPMDGPAGARGPDAESDKRRDAARARLREIEQAGPRPETVHTRVWEVLSAEQRQVVETRLEEVRARQNQMREEEYVRRRVGERREGAEGPPGPGRGPGPREDMAPGQERPPRRLVRPGEGPAARDPQERRERLLRLFEQLGPEEQEMVLNRLEQRLRDRGAGGPGAGRDRPPPPMDGVKVPPPEGEPGEAPPPPTRGPRRPRPAEAR
ncbi:MAG TPA: hypothetical protein VD963_08070 [Phycisphaerales bacterium]|nr:hypothetical protein [Phycisphaerales bacterium]